MQNLHQRGIEIGQERRKQNISRKKLGIAIGCSGSMIAKIEKGKVKKTEYREKAENFLEIKGNTND